MRRLAFILALFAAFAAPAILKAVPAHAYSYAAAGAEPLLDGREALFSAVSAGNWDAAQKAVDALKPEFDYLEANEQPGITRVFNDAIAAKDPAKVKAAFVLAASAEIQRRINGARDNLKDYQTAKVLVVRAQRFYTAIAGDLPPDVSKTVSANLQKALDAIGNPGVFGVGAKKPDPAAFAEARLAVLKALGRPT
jgi:hypothetical protein